MCQGLKSLNRLQDICLKFKEEAIDENFNANNSNRTGITDKTIENFGQVLKRLGYLEKIELDLSK